MESAHALTAMQKRRLVDLARTVPEALLEVGTTGKVFASIKAARELLGEDQWGCDDADFPNTPSSIAGGDDHDVGGVPLNNACGIFAGIRYEHMPPAPNFLPDLQYDDAGPAPYFSADPRYDVAAPALDFSADLRYDDAPSDPVYWTGLLAAALVPEGFLSEVYCEITHLISLHGEAGHVLFVCATRLGIQPGGGHSLGGQPDDDATWKRWKDLRASVVHHAHDALLRLKAAASALSAAAVFINWWPPESSARNGWSWVSAARQLVGDARRNLDEAKDSVRLMRDAVVREYFETWMILNRA